MSGRTTPWPEPVFAMMDSLRWRFHRMHPANRARTRTQCPAGAGYAPGFQQQSNHLPQASARPAPAHPTVLACMYAIASFHYGWRASYELEATNPDAEIYD